MLSSRGVWFLVVNVAMLIIGAIAIPFYSVVPALVAITVLAWFFYEWVQFL
jgi:hypothetical protein